MDTTIQMNLTIGATLQNGKYEISRILGQGGFGITYLVRHTLLNKTYALKEFFPHDYCNRDGSTSHVTVATQSNVDLVVRLRSRFIAEAQNIARLKHPNIIDIHDVFEENDTAYFVMDFIEGESLDDMVRRMGALPEYTAVSYAKAIASALDYIHQRNMTHFDVKPANIMVRQSDGVPVLIDFGLSKQYNDQGHANSTLLMGLSHGYSPIEQYMQSGIDTFSPQTDIYALGATLYTLLSGRVPPEAPKLIDKTIEVPVTISAPIANAVKWAMASTPERRCPTASAFIQALDNASAPAGGHTVAVGAASSQYFQVNTGQEQPAQQIQQQAQQPHYDTYLATSKKKSINGALVGGLIGGAIVILVSVFFIVFKTPERKPLHYDTATTEEVSVAKEEYTNAPEEKVVETVVAAAEEPEAVTVVEEVAFSASGMPDRTDGYYEFSGMVDGKYPTTYKLTFSTKSNGERTVTGKYAYLITLKKYGDKESSWFTVNGTVDGNFISWYERTSSDKNYNVYFEGRLNGTHLYGSCGAAGGDDTSHSVDASVN